MDYTVVVNKGYEVLKTSWADTAPFRQLIRIEPKLTVFIEFTVTSPYGPDPHTLEAK
jgi:hypothetical protein